MKLKDALFFGYSRLCLTFLILRFKIEKNRAQKCPIFLKLSIMSYLYVRKIKTVASRKKNDPTLETRKIALGDS